MNAAKQTIHDHPESTGFQIHSDEAPITTCILAVGGLQKLQKAETSASFL